MNKIVGVQAAHKEKISEADLQQLEREARAAVAKITEKPSIDVFYKSVDEIWAKGLNRQLIFQNKDQHLEYVTTYYNEQIAPLNLDQYRSLVLQQMLSQINALRAAVNSEKTAEAVRLHKEHEEKVLKNMQDQLDDLKDRNAKADKAIREELNADKN